MSIQWFSIDPKTACKTAGWDQCSGFYQFSLTCRLVLGDISRDGARSNREWTRQIHLSRSAAAGEVAILRANHDLIRPRRYSRTGVDAGAATRLDHGCAGFLEDIQVALAHAVFACGLRAELNVELH